MSEERILSDIVWTPERGLSEQQPEVRGIFLDNVLTGQEPHYPGKSRTNSGISINPTTALQSTMVLACSRILAESISSLPLHVYRRGENDTRIIAKDIPLYRVLSFAPNSWQTKFEWLEQLVMTLCLWGNSYTQIKSGRYGAVTELINLHPSNMEVERLENGRLRYSYTNPETSRLERYTQDQIMHVRWTPEPDGIKGMVPIEVARDAIALARACEIHASKYWSNFARPGVVLQTDGSLSPEAAAVLRDNWERLHRGVQESWRTAVLTNGLKAEPLGFTNEQSQYIDSRRYQGEEIGRVYRVPAALVQGTGIGNPETAGQEFVTYTLVPWLRRIESAISRSLIYNDDMFFAEFDVKGLLRGDSNSRASYYSTMIGLGAMSINEVRRAENLPPLGPDADHHFVAMNTQTLEEAVKPKPEQPSPFGGPPAPAPGGPPSLPEVKPGKAPIKSPDGVKSEPKMAVPHEAVEENRAFCATGEGNGVDNSCGKKGEGDSPTESPVRGLRRGEKSEKQTKVARKLYQMGMRERQVKAMVSKLGGKPSKSSVFMEDGKINIIVRDHSSNELYSITAGYNGAHVDSVEPIDDEKISSILEIVKQALPSKISDRLWGAGRKYPISVGHGKSQWKSHKKKDRRAFCPTGEGGGRDNSCGSSGGKGNGGPKDGGKPAAGDSQASSNSDDIGRDDGPQIDPVKLLEKIAASPNGFTLDPYSAEQPKTGIMVSEFPNDSKRALQITTESVNSEETIVALSAWINGNMDVIKGRNDRFVGGWMSDGKYYLDIATRFEDAEAALEAGRNARQLAVFNLETLNETWIQYEDGDARKPADWDDGFAKAKKNHPDLGEHGKKSVRSLDLSGYTDEERALHLIREVRNRERRPDQESGHSDGRIGAGDIPRDQKVGGSNRSVERRETDRCLVQGRSGGSSGTVRGLIEEARRFDTESSVKIEFRDCGTSLADYDNESSTLYVSDSFDDAKADKCREMVASGWLSQPNPLMHELAHAFHARANQRSYEKSRDISFTEEQRAVITAGVSRFAGTNGREFMAEFLAGAWAGREYSPEVVAIYESVLGAE